MLENFCANVLNRSIEDILSAISFENKIFYIMGDFNINILNSHSHQLTNECSLADEIQCHQKRD